MSEKIRWGIVGTGQIAHAFARDFAHAEGGELVAVASRTTGSAQRFAGQHGIPRAIGGYQALFEAGGIDAVYIATPHTLHLPNATDALRANKAVLCEKPLTTTPGETVRLLAVAERSESYLMEAMWTWFLPAMRRALEWCEAGRIGNLRHVQADFGYPMHFDPGSRLYRPDLAGGCLLDMGIYPVALAWLFTRRDPLRISVVGREAPSGVEDDLAVTFDYGDCTATLATSFRCKLPNAARLIGDRGLIEIPDFWRARECSLFELDRLVDRFTDRRVSLGYDYETTAVNRDLHEGRLQSRVVTWADSLKFQEHMAAIRRASMRPGPAGFPQPGDTGP